MQRARIRKRIYKTRGLAGADIFDYIEAFYNRTRHHSFLGGIGPEAFESAEAGICLPIQEQSAQRLRRRSCFKETSVARG